MYKQIVIANIRQQKQLKTITKQGQLNKQSRYLKSWKHRWFVVTPQTIMTFKKNQVYRCPTQVIPLKTIRSVTPQTVVSCGNYAFKIQTYDMTFHLKAQNSTQREQWIEHINKAISKINNITEKK